MSHSPKHKIWARALTALLALFAAIVASTPAWAQSAGSTNGTNAISSLSNKTIGEIRASSGLTVQSSVNANLEAGSSLVGVTGGTESNDGTSVYYIQLADVKAPVSITGSIKSGTNVVVRICDTYNAGSYPINLNINGANGFFAIDASGIISDLDNNVNGSTVTSSTKPLTINMNACNLVTGQYGLFVDSNFNGGKYNVKTYAPNIPVVMNLTGENTITGNKNIEQASVINVGLPNAYTSNGSNGQGLQIAGTGSLTVTNPNGTAYGCTMSAGGSTLNEPELTISGGATLTVTSAPVGTASAIYCWDNGMTLSGEGTTLNATGSASTGTDPTKGRSGAGILLNGTSLMSVGEGATVNATGEDGTSDEPYGGVGLYSYVDGPTITISEGATFTATGGAAGGTGVAGGTAVYFAGGTGNVISTEGTFTATGGAATETGTTDGGDAVAMKGGSFYQAGGTTTLTGGDGNGSSGAGVNLAGTNDNITLVAGNFTAASGVSGTGSNQAVTGGNLDIANLEKAGNNGPTAHLIGGRILNHTNGVPFSSAMGANGSSINIYDNVNVFPGSGTQADPGFSPYNWLALAGADGNGPSVAIGFAGAATTPVLDVPTMGSPALQFVAGDTYNATTSRTSNILIEPAKVESLILGTSPDYATNGTVVTPEIDAGTFEGVEGEVPIVPTVIPSTSIEAQEGEGYTLNSGRITMGPDATGNTVTVNTTVPKTVTNINEAITGASGDVPMTYPITLNGNGGNFPLYPYNNENTAERPTNYSTYTLWTQPGTGELLNVANSANVNSTATSNFTNKEGETNPSLKSLTGVLGALPEATTTNQEAPYFQGWFTEAENGSKAAQPFDTTQTIYAHFSNTPPAQEPEEVPVYRLYNPYSYEHLYTTNETELNALINLGWRYEDIAWNAPSEGVAVWRLYNPYSFDHYYTTDKAEYNALMDLGWRGETIVWYSEPDTTQNGVTQLFNPYETKNTHLWTTDEVEINALIDQGWQDQGPKWYALSLPE